MTEWLLILTLTTIDGCSVTTQLLPTRNGCVLAQKSFIARNRDQRAYSVKSDAQCIQINKDGVK